MRRFFEVQLPAMIHENSGVFGVTRGSVAFAVHGAGDWLLTLGGSDAAAAISEVASFDADLTLMFTHDVFCALLDGVVPEEGNGFTYDGRPELLVTVAKLLGAPLGGVMGARAAAL